MRNDNMLPAVPVELFTILDNGLVNLLVVCPVCRNVHFIEVSMDFCNMPGDTDVYGNPIDRSPMEIVCDECHAYAAQVIPEQLLNDMLRSGHIEAYLQVVMSVAEPGRILPPLPLTTSDDVWNWLAETNSCLIDISTAILSYEFFARTTSVEVAYG